MERGEKTGKKSENRCNTKKWLLQVKSKGLYATGTDRKQHSIIAPSHHFKSVGHPVVGILQETPGTERVYR